MYVLPAEHHAGDDFDPALAGSVVERDVLQG
jgi:hypothetical protein